MAVFNEVLVGRFGSLLAKAFQMVGVGNPAPQLESSLQPVVPIWALPLEYKYLAEEYAFWGGAASVGGVATKAYFSIANPANSGVLCIIDTIQLANDSNDTFTFSYATTASAAANAASKQADARSVRGTTMNLRAGTDVATDWPARASILNNFRPPLTGFILQRANGLFVLQPQNALIIECETVTTVQRTFLGWTERTQLKSELTLR